MSLPSAERERWHLSARRPHDPPARWERRRLLGSILGRMQFGSSPADFETGGADETPFAFYAGGELWAMAYDPDANGDPSAQETIRAVVSGRGRGGNFAGAAGGGIGGWRGGGV